MNTDLSLPEVCYNGGDGIDEGVVRHTCRGYIAYRKEVYGSIHYTFTALRQVCYNGVYGIYEGGVRDRKSVAKGKSIDLGGCRNYT